MHVVTQDASPHGPRLFVLWNPPLVVGPRVAGAQSGSKVATGAAARAADTVAKKRDPGGPHGGKLRAVEKKRAKQEAARSAVRSKNNTKPGSSSCAIESVCPRLTLFSEPYDHMHACATCYMHTRQHPTCGDS